MASTQMTRVDAFGLLPSLLIVIMSILASSASSRTRRPCRRPDTSAAIPDGHTAVRTMAPARATVRSGASACPGPRDRA